MKNIYVVLIDTREGCFLLAADKNFSIQSFKTKKEAIAFFEDSYNDSHKRGYTSSMSACINWITYNPSIIKVSNLDEIGKNIVGNKPRGFKLHHISGLMYGISTIPEAITYWKRGIKPKLISEKTFL